MLRRHGLAVSGPIGSSSAEVPLNDERSDRIAERRDDHAGHSGPSQVSLDRSEPEQCRDADEPQPETQNAPQSQAFMHAEKSLHQARPTGHHGDEDAGHRGADPTLAEGDQRKRNGELGRWQTQKCRSCASPSIAAHRAAHAIGTKTKAASVTRPNATVTGESSATANLMKKYGRPQMMLSAAKAPHRSPTHAYPSKSCRAAADSAGNATRDCSGRSSDRLFHGQFGAKAEGIARGSRHREHAVCAPE